MFSKMKSDSSSKKNPFPNLNAFSLKKIMIYFPLKNVLQLK